MSRGGYTIGPPIGDSWAYRPTRASEQGYELVHDGQVVAEVRFDPPEQWSLREALLMEDMVVGLNNPVPLTERGFRGDWLLRRRGRRVPPWVGRR